MFRMGERKVNMTASCINYEKPPWPQLQEPGCHWCLISITLPSVKKLEAPGKFFLSYSSSRTPPPQVLTYQSEFSREIEPVWYLSFYLSIYLPIYRESERQKETKRDRDIESNRSEVNRLTDCRCFTFTTALRWVFD